jgi:C-terminal processing protease CtpA/Prc
MKVKQYLIPNYGMANVLHVSPHADDLIYNSEKLGYKALNLEKINQCIEKLWKLNSLLRTFCFLFAAIFYSPITTSQTKNADVPTTQVNEVVELMSQLSRDALKPLGYPQLFEACTHMAPVLDVVGFPKTSWSRTKALSEMSGYFWSLHFATDEDKSIRLRQCMSEMLALTGNGAKLYTIEEIKKLGTVRNFNVGLKLTRSNGEWLVREAIAGMPVADAGMQTGDTLIKINDTLVQALDKQDIADLLAISAEKNVTLSWRSRSEKAKLRTETFMRVRQIESDRVIVENMADHIYIRVPDFYEFASGEILNAIRAHSEKESLVKVLDLRGNPGGLMRAVHWHLALFGKNLKSVKWKAAKFREDSDATGYFSVSESLNLRPFEKKDIPEIPSATELEKWSHASAWYVLTDGETGSGATWLAGVLRELNGAFLVGSTADTSVGIDIIRQINTQLIVKFEVGKFLLPSGKALDVTGLAPDLPFEITAESIKPLPKNGNQWLEDPLYLYLKKRF